MPQFLLTYFHSVLDNNFIVRIYGILANNFSRFWNSQFFYTKLYHSFFKVSLKNCRENKMEEFLKQSPKNITITFLNSKVKNDQEKFFFPALVNALSSFAMMQFEQFLRSSKLFLSRFWEFRSSFKKFLEFSSIKLSIVYKSFSEVSISFEIWCKVVSKLHEHFQELFRASLYESILSN